MAGTQESWKEVATKVESLGLKLKLHLEQEQDVTTEAEPGDTKAAVEDLGTRLQDAFESFGNAAKDPAVQTDVKDIGTLLKDALINTFNSVGADLEDVLRKAEKAGETAADKVAEAMKPADGVVDAVEAASDVVDAVSDAADDADSAST